MTARRGHPGELLWYVSGSLEGTAAASIEAHLDLCGDCRHEAASLASMMTSLQRQSRTDHVSPEELVDHEAGAPATPSRRILVAGHLEDCPACREDLETLARARRREEALEPAGAPRDLRRAWTARAAAAFVLLLAAATRPAPRPGAPGEEIHGPPLVVFAAPHRGDRATPLLRGAGPWQVRVVLPYDAPEGAYRVRVTHEDGADPGDAGRTALADGDGGLTTVVDPLPAKGRYRMVLRSEASPGEPAALYHFDVEPDPGAPQP